VAELILNYVLLDAGYFMHLKHIMTSLYASEITALKTGLVILRRKARTFFDTPQRATAS
jgi:hypothetical protein